MRRRLKPEITFSAAVLGFTSIISQVAVFRELLIAFSGNELYLGLALASWLFWVAAGSLLLGRYAEEAGRRPLAIAFVQVYVALVIPALLYLSRFVKDIFHLSTGEIVGIGPALLSSTAVLAPLCLALGFTFALLCVSRRAETAGAARVGSVYVLEAIGSAGGGLLFSFILVKLLTPTQTAFLLGGLNLAAAVLAAKPIRFKFFPAVILIAYITMLSLGATGKLENAAVVRRWGNLKLKYNANSIYGNVAAVALGEERAFYENGLLSFSTGDDRFAEETGHIPLLAHPHPERVLLIGGGMSGILDEILKHPIESVTYVELDPLLIEAAKEVLPEEALRFLDDERVNVVFDDGRRFVKAKRSQYDVVILALPDPLTALVNRFYSEEFLCEVDHILKPRGIFSLGITLAENYLNPEQERLLACVYQTVSSRFEGTILIPGGYTYILASSDIGLTGVTADKLLNRQANLGIETAFITEGYLSFRIDPARTAFFTSSMERAKRPRANRDMKPAGYLYATTAWLTRLDSRSAKLLGRLSHIQPLWYLLPLVLLFGSLMHPTLRRPSSSAPVAAAIFTTGYAEMVFQVVVIYSFQVFFGFLYYRLGLILTSFMIGLAGGGILMTSRGDAVLDPRYLFMKVQAAMCFYPVFLAAFILLVLQLSRSGPLNLSIQMAFAFLPAVAGFLGGVQFPLAVRISLRGAPDTGRVAGFLYGIDLLGSCAGAVTASALLIPAIGVIGTCLIAFSGSFASMLLIVASNARRRLRH